MQVHLLLTICTDEIVGSVTSYMKSLMSPFVAVYTATSSSHMVCIVRACSIVKLLF